MEKTDSKPSFMELETKIIEVLRTVYDPEIPVNIYDLGLIYKIDVDDDKNVVIDMTFTSPNCPITDEILIDVKTKVNGIRGIKNATINIVFEPQWTMNDMSEEAKIELGLD